MNVSVPTSAAAIGVVAIFVGLIWLAFHGGGAKWPLWCCFGGGIFVDTGAAIAVIDNISNAVGHALSSFTQVMFGVGISGILLLGILLYVWLHKHIHPKKGRGAPSGRFHRFGVAFACIAAGLIVGAVLGPTVHQMLDNTVAGAGASLSAVVKGS